VGMFSKLMSLASVLWREYSWVTGTAL